VEAIVAMPAGWFLGQRQHLVKAALSHGFPVIAGPHAYAEEGALIGYGVDRAANVRRAAYYVDKILKGEKAGDLPIEQPMRVQLTVNLRTAKALQLSIPHEFVMRADRVIE
jgi:putative ABC transport system substrate-binding protein